MKTPLITSLLAALSLAATAQPAPTADAQAQAPTAADTAPASTAPAEKQPAERSLPRVNPFTGKGGSMEELQRQLEISKIHTQLLEEQLRNASLSEDLRNVPLRKQAEAAQAQTQTAREEAQRQELARTARLAEQAEADAKETAARQRREAAAERKAAERRAADEEKRRIEAAALTAKTRPAEALNSTPTIELLGVTAVGLQRSALLSINGNVASVQDGDATPLGPVSIDADGAVHLDQATYRVHSTSLARVKLTDFQPAQPSSGAAGPGNTANQRGALVIGSQPPPQQQPSVLPPPVPGSALSQGRNSAAPTLQLPPGMSVVPASN